MANITLGCKCIQRQATERLLDRRSTARAAGLPGTSGSGIVFRASISRERETWCPSSRAERIILSADEHDQGHPSIERSALNREHRHCPAADARPPLVATDLERRKDDFSFDVEVFALRTEIAVSRRLRRGFAPRPGIDAADTRASMPQSPEQESAAGGVIHTRQRPSCSSKNNIGRTETCSSRLNRGQ
jgi:hypothetical protein